MISGASDIARRLRREAEELGFHAVGFCDAEVLEKERDYLAARGPGPFEPEDLPPRTDPGMLLDGARSVIVVAMSYHHQDPPRPQGLRGRLSKYCRGLDYHDLMLERLRQLAHRLETEHGARSVVYVDTGPPLERAFAEKAGLGRMGKNTNLIIPKLGSWVFLGMLVTDLEIEPDSAATYSICGQCRLCLEACPTRCLDDWVLDSERCLGYLNQKDGEVPEWARESMGDWLFGCDVCQDVCPHNKRALSGLIPEFAPLEYPGAFPDLVSLVEMTEVQFQEWFGPTAADWRGSQAIRRNALVALGNTGDRRAIPVVEAHLSDSDEVLAEQAAWAVERLEKAR